MKVKELQTVVPGGVMVTAGEYHGRSENIDSETLEKEVDFISVGICYININLKEESK